MSSWPSDSWQLAARSRASQETLAEKKRSRKDRARKRKPATRKTGSVIPFKPRVPAVEPTFKMRENFYASKEWLTSRARYLALKAADGRCQCCGASRAEVRLVVDHIKPVRKYWHLRFDKNNTQVLCDDCNLGKGSWDETDFRS